MKRILFALLILISHKATAQINAISYQDCLATKFCLDCGDIKAAYNGTTTIGDYFKSKIDKKYLEGIRGSLFIQAIVDTTGNVCCKSISNNTNATNEQIKQLQVNKHLKNMPPWIPAQTNGNPETSSIMLLMKIKESGEFALDYYRIGEIEIK
jgi:hypothetical protein